MLTMFAPSGAASCVRSVVNRKFYLPLFTAAIGCSQSFFTFWLVKRVNGRWDSLHNAVHKSVAVTPPRLRPSLFDRACRETKPASGETLEPILPRSPPPTPSHVSCRRHLSLLPQSLPRILLQLTGWVCTGMENCCQSEKAPRGAASHHFSSSLLHWSIFIFSSISLYN